MAAVVGALRVVLGADSAALDKGLKDAQSSLKGFATAAATIAAGIGLEKLVQNAADAFTHAVKQGFEAADTLGKAAQKIGIPVEELSKLKYAAELSGVSLSSLEKGVGTLSKALVAQAGGATSPAATALTALGISAKDSNGQLTPTTQVIEQLAEKFSTMKDGAGKTTLAMQVFGKAGKELLPFLNEGKDGLARMFDEAEKLGLVISSKTVAATTHFNDDMKTLSKISQGVALQVTAELAPAFAVLSERLKASALDGNIVTTISQGIISVMTTVAEAVQIVGLNFTNMAEQISGAWKILKSILTLDGGQGFREGWDQITSSLSNYKVEMANISAATQKFLADAGQKSLDWAGESKKRTDDAANATKAHKNALDSFISSQDKSIAAHEAEAAAVGKTTGTKEKLKAVMQAEEIALQNNIALTPTVTAKIDALGNRAEQAAIQLKAMQLTQEFLSPNDRYIQQMTDLNNILQRTSLSEETFQAAALKIKFPSLSQGIKDSSDLNKNLDTLANTAIGDLSSALASITTGSKTASEAFKTFGLSVLSMLTQLIVKAIILKALEVAIGFSGGGEVSVDVWASGTDLKMAGGGSVGPGLGGFVAGPGTGTSDSILAMLSDGEFVVNAASTRMFLPLLKAINSGSISGMASGGIIGSSLSSSEMISSQNDISARGVVNLNFTGDNFSRDGVRGILQTVKELIADGYELKLA